MLHDPLTATIEMRLLARKQGGSERFTCPVDFWNFMLQLGLTFGWRPHGASYVMIPIRPKVDARAVRHDYQPGARHDAKVVNDGDATRWADALSVARISKHLGKMIAASGLVEGPAQPGAANVKDGVLTSIDAFIEYLRKGAFSFAMKDVDNVVPIRGRQ